MSLTINCGSMIQVVNSCEIAKVVSLSKNGWLKACTKAGKQFSVRNSPKTVKLFVEPKTVKLFVEPNYLSLLPDDVIRVIYYWKDVYETFDIMYDATVRAEARLEHEQIKRRKANLDAKHAFCNKLSGRKPTVDDLLQLSNGVKLDEFVKATLEATRQYIYDFEIAETKHEEAKAKVV